MGLVEDIRHGIRAFLGQPRFTTFVVVVLGVGIGATATLFAVVDSVLLTPLPHDEPHELVEIYSARPPDNRRTMLSVPEVEALGALQKTFEAVATMQGARVVVTGGEHPRVLGAARVSDPFFEILGIVPELGRRFSAEEYSVPGSGAVLVSHGFWRLELGADPDVVGREVRLDERPFRVVGVLPEGFEYRGRPVDVLLPYAPGPGSGDRRQRDVLAVARLADGTTLPAARTVVGELGSRLAEEHPESNAGWEYEVVGIQEDMVGDARQPLALLLGAVGLVLMIACANVAHLMLARMADRRRALAIRAALGAGRGRLVRQQLVESLVLAVAGGALGVLMALWGVDLFVRFSPVTAVQLRGAQVSGATVAFVAALSVASALIFGLLPALRASSVSPASAMKGAGHGSTTRRDSRYRAALVISEVALAAVLLVGAGLMVESVRRLVAVDLGFEVDRLVWTRLSLPSSRYPTAAARAGFFRDLTADLDALPSVESATVVSNVPLDIGSTSTRVRARGDDPDDAFSVDFYRVGASYFETLGLPVLAGRGFTDADRLEGPRVALVSESLARRLWPDGAGGVGRQVQLRGAPDAPPVTVVGVVADVRHRILASFGEALYLPHAQVGLPTMMVLVRTDTPARDLAEPLRQRIWEHDPLLPVESVLTVEDLHSGWIARQSRIMTTLTAFAALAVVLALVGLYAVLAYSVARRTREIGIRKALGARSPDVVLASIGRGAGLAAVGVALGLMVAAGATRLLSSLLYEVTPIEPALFALLGVAFLVAACLASALPALRAARVDPMVALRQDV